VDEFRRFGVVEDNSSRLATSAAVATFISCVTDGSVYDVVDDNSGKLDRLDVNSSRLNT
jgi:hypothetical protein